MTKVTFNVRLLFDYAFYNEIIKSKSIQSKPPYLTKLMYINANSIQYKRYHNIMSKKTFDLILKDNSFMDRGFLRASFYDLDEPEDIERIKEEVERNIKYAINLTAKHPFRVVIITSKKEEEKYKESPHYNGVKEISIKSGLEAIRLIDSLFEECTSR